MKVIKSFNQFEAKKYSDKDMEKDVKRIDDMAKKAGKDKSQLLRLAQTMANRITNYEKAYYRGSAAEDQNYHDVAKIFYARAEELNK